MLAHATINSHKHGAKFAFKSKGNATSFECALVRIGHGKHAKAAAAHYARCRSPKTYRNLARGNFIFYVRALGPGGTQPTALSHKFKIA